MLKLLNKLLRKEKPAPAQKNHQAPETPENMVLYKRIQELQMEREKLGHRQAEIGNEINKIFKKLLDAAKN